MNVQLQMNERQLECLQQGDALDNRPPVDYRLAQNQHGQFAAIRQAQQMAQEHIPLTVADVQRWQDLLQSKQNSDFAEFITDFNRRLLALGQFPETVEVVKLMADAVRRFDNSAMGRLLMNYVATWCHCPLIIVRVADREALTAARRSQNAMCAFIGKKFQEDVFDRNGNVLSLVKHYGLSARYRDPETMGELIVEWHPLVLAIDAWEKP